MDLDISVKQKQVLSAQMIQTMKILQMNSMELENYINEQSMENPMLVLDEPEKRDIGKEELDRERKLEWLESTDLQN